MATNIIEEIRISLQYPPLQKVDPNLQETKEKYHQAISEKLAQAAIPAVLTAFYRFLRTDVGCEKFISAGSAVDWLAILFEQKEGEAVEKVAQYAAVTINHAKNYMENIADEAVRLIKESAGINISAATLKTYMNGQRHNILVYLPAALQMGDLLNDESLDDRTNKMEGPVSSFIHKIENNFSGG